MNKTFQVTATDLQNPSLSTPNYSETSFVIPGDWALLSYLNIIDTAHLLNYYKADNEELTVIHFALLSYA